MPSRLSALTSLVSLLAVSAQQECPNNVCPGIGDEVSFFQRFLETQVRSQEVLKKDESILSEGEPEESASEKWQAFRQAASDDEAPKRKEPVLSLLTAQIEQTTGLAMGAGWWILLLICCCCCGPAIVGLIMFPFMVPPKKPIGDIENKEAKKYREMFDKECEPEDQHRYNFHSETGGQFLKKCNDMFTEAFKEKDKGKMKDLKDIVEKHNSEAASAFDKDMTISRDEFYEMMKYFEFKRDKANGVLDKKADSSSSSDSDKDKKKADPKKGGKTAKKKAKDDSSSSDGGAADIATGIAVGIVADEVVDAALDGSDSD